jgi:hypothetical protein
MIFLKAAPVELDDLSAEAREALHREIESFIKAGGVLTMDLWAKMEPAERAVYKFVAQGGAEKEVALLHQMADAIAAKGAAP